MNLSVQDSLENDSTRYWRCRQEGARLEWIFDLETSTIILEEEGARSEIGMSTNATFASTGEYFARSRRVMQ